MILGFTGYKGCGKDTAAAFAPYVKIYKFADPLKDMLRAYLKYWNLEREAADSVLEGRYKEVELYQFMDKTPRWAMQSLGTEWGRNLIGSDIWLATMENRLLTHLNKKKSAEEVIAVTDVRFLNEAALISKMGGKLIRITRPGVEPDAVAHQSEAEMKLIVPHHTIVNDGTVEELQAKVKAYAGV